MTVDIIARRRTEKHGRTAQITWLAPTSGWNSFQYLPVTRLVLLQRARVVRPHVARGDRVDVNILRGPFVR